MLASASRGFPDNKSEILLWDLANMNCLGSLNFHENNITSLAFSADNRYLVSVGKMMHLLYLCYVNKKKMVAYMKLKFY